MQALMGTAIFRWQSQAKWQQKGTSRARIFQISILSFPLASHDQLLLHKRPHEYCAKVPKQFACKCAFMLQPPLSLLHVDPWLGASSTLRFDYCYFYLSRFSQLFSSFDTFISLHIVWGIFVFHQQESYYSLFAGKEMQVTNTTSTAFS